MGVTSTIPVKQNVVCKYIDGTSGTDLSLSVLRVEDALVLGDITKDAELNFDIASLSGSSHGDRIATWTNTVPAGGAAAAKSYTLHNGGASANHPSYAVTGTQMTEALFFNDFSDSFKSAREFMELQQSGAKLEYSTTGEFVFFVVFSYGSNADIDNQPTILSREAASAQHQVIIPGKKLTLYGKQTSLPPSPDFAGLYLDQDSFQDSTPYVRVVRRDKDGNVSIYDETSKSMVTSITANNVGFDFGFNYVGASSILDNSRDAGGQPTNGVGVYISHIGLFTSDIGSQKAQALGRLLSDKYIKQIT